MALVYSKTLAVKLMAKGEVKDGVVADCSQSTPDRSTLVPSMISMHNNLLCS